MTGYTEKHKDFVLHVPACLEIVTCEVMLFKNLYEAHYSQLEPMCAVYFALLLAYVSLLYSSMLPVSSLYKICHF
jgi:hypothetical protein